MTHPTRPLHTPPVLQPVRPFPGQRWGHGAQSALEELRHDEAEKPRAQGHARAGAPTPSARPR